MPPAPDDAHARVLRKASSSNEGISEARSSGGMRASEILLSTPFFQKLEAANEGIIGKLASVAKFCNYPRGTVLFRQRDPALNCYIVVNGQIGIFGNLHGEFMTPRQDNNADDYPPFHGKPKAGEEQPERYRTAEGFNTWNATSALGSRLAVLRKSSVLGELALQNDAPRSASARCVEDSELLYICKDDYGEIQKTMDDTILKEFADSMIQHCGSVLRAWRLVLDPDGDQSLLYGEFIEACEGLDITDKLKIDSLWSACIRRSRERGRNQPPGLSELSPKDYKVMQTLREFLAENYGGAVGMFAAVTGNCVNGLVSKADFFRACQGCKGHEQVFNEYLDARGSGFIGVADIALVEIDGVKRKAALDVMFALSLDKDKSVSIKLRKHERARLQAQETAVKEFRQRLRGSAGGSFIRGFRRYLDSSGKLTLSKVDLLLACKKVAFAGDASALWRALDSDADGIVTLHDLDVRMALVLASFRRWCYEQSGGCVKALDALSASRGPKVAPKWVTEEFSVHLSGAWNCCGLPVEISQRKAIALLVEAFDVGGLGIITPGDAAFLEKAELQPWLCADADLEAMNKLTNAFKTGYGSQLGAWRRLLDTKDTNRVHYKTFFSACQAFKLQGSAPGIWRALDKNLTGALTFRELDPAAAKALMEFKSWGEVLFGTVRRAFLELDQDHASDMSVASFKRSISNMGFRGDVEHLVKILRPEVSSQFDMAEARVTLEDVEYLSSWKPDEAEEARYPEEDSILRNLAGATSSPQPPRSQASEKSRSTGKLPPASTLRTSSSMPSLQTPGSTESKAWKGSRSPMSSSRGLGTGTMPPLCAGFIALDPLGGTSPGMKKAPWQKRVDFMAYCKNAKDFEAFKEHMDIKIASGTGPGSKRVQRTFNLVELLHE
eukprot:TRINITY_DN38674_c0_g1_i1.p1 TRINITY_DN38674_c0_g1~~TRINITY_DN38674_c0_g1_i1.p1  ORF type:complete len:896 (-),score=148.95 TRINITY_DN38674_c0_g1_i1:330-3017(-)